MLTTYQMLQEMMTSDERRRFWFLVTLSFFLSAFEAVSVISILPFLKLLGDPTIIEEVAILSWVFVTFGFESTTQFTIAAGIGVFLAVLLGLFLKMVTIWATTRFSMMRSYTLSARLLSIYLRQPYEWFLAHRASELGTSVLSEVDKVVHESLLPAVRLIPEIFSAVLLLLALCLLEPSIALGGGLLLGGSYTFIFLAVRQILNRLGRRRVASNQERFHVVQEATGGLKELKILGLEGGFLNRFRGAALQMARVQTQFLVISALPRYLLEAVAFGGMILLALLLLARGDSEIADLVPTLGLIAVVGLRLLPALQQIYTRFASVRQSRAALAIIHGDLTKLAVTAEIHNSDLIKPLFLSQALSLENISYSYPSTDHAALTNISLTIVANSTVGIVGGTGAGKTSLVDIILALLVPDTGRMRADGTEITTDTRRSWQRSCGYVPQSIFLTDGSVTENIAYGRPIDQIDFAAVEKASRAAALHEFVTTTLPDGYDTLVGDRGIRLSGGQRQRIGIARALYHDPSILIFDEATSALDTLTEKAVMDAVHVMSGKKTILMIAHRLSTVRNCDHLFLLRKGRIAAEGKFDALVEIDEQFRQMAGDS